MREMDKSGDIESYRFLDIAQILVFEPPEIPSHSCVVDKDIGFFFLIYDPIYEIFAALRF